MVWNSQFEEAQSSPAFVCFLIFCDASLGALFGWQCNAWNIRVFPENNDASSPMFWNAIEEINGLHPTADKKTPKISQDFCSRRSFNRME
jgi:hypothetical protein